MATAYFFIYVWGIYAHTFGPFTTAAECNRIRVEVVDKASSAKTLTTCYEGPIVRIDR